jgi:hypothetical protein
VEKTKSLDDECAHRAIGEARSRCATILILNVRLERLDVATA